jgi:tRNA threonylcarbamoyladenosine biosynthesis protein TsaB
MHPFHIALDTATSIPVVALMQGEKCLHEWQGPEALSHHETLLRGIDECLKAGGVNRRELAFLTVGIGPGMFTGLRIGIATAKFLADPLAIPCVPVSTLVALALQAERPGQSVWALADARAKRIYALHTKQLTADFSSPPEEETALPPEEAAKLLNAGDFLIGEGAALYAAHWPEGVEIASHNALRASSLGKIGAIRYTLGLTCTALELAPKYLKNPQGPL